MTYTINTIIKFSTPLVINSQIGPSGVQYGSVVVPKFEKET